MASASSTRASLATPLALNSLSCSDMAAGLAPKKTSWAPRNRFQSSSSTPRGAEPAAFQRVIRSR